MKRRALLVVVTLGLSLVVGPSGKGNDPARAVDDTTTNNEEKEYAKIELKGLLIDWFRDPAIQHGPRLGGIYLLDLSKESKELREGGWHKLEGEIVIVKGRLVNPSKSKGALRVVVESIRLADK